MRQSDEMTSGGQIESVALSGLRVRTDKWLLRFAIFAFLGAGVCALLLAIDHRLVTGAPVWLKPLKFFVSAGIYVFSLRWVIPHMANLNLAHRMAQVTVVGLVYELVIISLQAARGVRSHFNFSTTLDATLFISMGVVIMIVWLAGLVITWQVARKPSEQLKSDPGTRTALVWGMSLFLIGAIGGQKMTSPKPEQLAQIQAGQMPPEIGGHAVGVADGGVSVPLVGWSREGGDLRIAHFFGIHGLQVLILLNLGLIALGLTSAHRARWAHGVGLLSLGLWAVLFLQAYRGMALLPI